MRAFLVALAAAALLFGAVVLTRWLFDDASREAASAPPSAVRESEPALDVARGAADRAAPTPTRAAEADVSAARAPVRAPVDAIAEELAVFDFEFDEDEVPTRERVRGAIETAVAAHFPSHRLSSDEVERATDALVTLRETQEALRALPMGPETAEQRRIFVERIGEATSEFNAVLDVDPAEFTSAADPGGGLDRFDPNEALPEAEFIERSR